MERRRLLTPADLIPVDSRVPSEGGDAVHCTGDTSLLVVLVTGITKAHLEMANLPDIGVARKI